MPALSNNPRWSEADRRRFADGDRLRAKTIPVADKPAPTVDEWEGFTDGVLGDDTPLACGIENPESCEVCE